MIKAFTKILEPGVTATLATPDSGKDLDIKTIKINGGANGGNYTLIIGDYQEKFSIDAENTVIDDHGVFLTNGQSLQAISEEGGISFYLSGVDTVTKEDL
jgi:hypothetical protein